MTSLLEIKGEFVKYGENVEELFKVGVFKLIERLKVFLITFISISSDIFWVILFFILIYFYFYLFFNFLILPR
jgi:hypothetical protein